MASFDLDIDIHPTVLIRYIVILQLGLHKPM